VSVLNGRVVSAYTKQPPTGANLEDLRPEWTHQLVTTRLAAVVATAREGARRIGLDYAGVDVIVDRRTGIGRRYMTVTATMARAIAAPSRWVLGRVPDHSRITVSQELLPWTTADRPTRARLLAMCSKRATKHEPLGAFPAGCGAATTPSSRPTRRARTAKFGTEPCR
jgi:hypothetical protein